MLRWLGAWELAIKHDEVHKFSICKDVSFTYLSIQPSVQRSSGSFLVLFQTNWFSRQARHIANHLHSITSITFWTPTDFRLVPYQSCYFSTIKSQISQNKIPKQLSSNFQVLLLQLSYLWFEHTTLMGFFFGIIFQRPYLCIVSVWPFLYGGVLDLCL